MNDPVGNFDSHGTIPLVAAIPLLGGVVGGSTGAVSEFASGGNVVDGFVSGFVSGAIGTAVGLAASAIPGVGVAVSGAVGGFTGSVTDSLVNGSSLSAGNVAFGTINGALGSTAAAKLLPTRGRLPDLLTDRNASNFGKNPQRLVGQEAISGAVGGGVGTLLGMGAGSILCR